MAKLFGWEFFKSPAEEKKQEKIETFSPKENDDGSSVLSPVSAHYGTYVDQSGKISDEAGLIRKYRDMAVQPECEEAIDSIINEAVVQEFNKSPVTITLDDLNIDEKVKDQIHMCFQECLMLLNFKDSAFDIFKKWYVDGRLYYHIIIDENNPKKGILELRSIDALKIRKVKEKKKKERSSKKLEQQGMTRTEYNEYFVYRNDGWDKDGGRGKQDMLKIAPDSIAHSHSGLLNESKSSILSHLHKAIRPLNQLRMLEDAVVVYRISRAPERRIFNIDVGNLPKIKADQYIRQIMNQYNNKIVYDANTGEIRDDRRFQATTEDFWLPRKEGSTGSSIETLPGGQNLGELDDVDYFRRKLFRALKLPLSRLEENAGFSLGRASEISRDEIEFGKFATRLQIQFTKLFDDILKKQLILKNICSLEDWKKIRAYIYYEFEKDSHFSELKHSELMNERLQILQSIAEYQGRYFSKEYVQKNVLRMTSEEIEEESKRMDAEKDSGDGPPEEEDDIYSSETGPAEEPPINTDNDDEDIQEYLSSDEIFKFMDKN